MQRQGHIRRQPRLQFREHGVGDLPADGVERAAANVHRDRASDLATGFFRHLSVDIDQPSENTSANAY
jgi:hypothetical protein